MRGDSTPGKLNLMCRMTFAAIAASAALSPLGAQQVPGRDLFQFPLGTLAEAPALADAAGGGFWNPATIALHGQGRLLLSAAALNSSPDQSVSSQLGTLAYQLRGGITGGISVAQSSVSDLARTDTDPQSMGDAIPYRSTILSGVVAVERKSMTLGLALRRRSGAVDQARGAATSIDLGGVVNRPGGLPIRLALSSFLLSPSRGVERTSAVGAIEGYLPVARDLRAGLSYQQDRGSGNETFLYAARRARALDLRGGIARQRAFGASTTRLRLGVGLRYAGYLVGIAREDGTAGLGATYQFLLTTVFP